VTTRQRAQAHLTADSQAPAAPGAAAAAAAGQQQQQQPQQGQQQPGRFSSLFGGMLQGLGLMPAGQHGARRQQQQGQAQAQAPRQQQGQAQQQQQGQRQQQFAEVSIVRISNDGQAGGAGNANIEFTTAQVVSSCPLFHCQRRPADQTMWQGPGQSYCSMPLVLTSAPACGPPCPLPVAASHALRRASQHAPGRRPARSAAAGLAWGPPSG
jgi:hypothetical protein